MMIITLIWIGCATLWANNDADNSSALKRHQQVIEELLAKPYLSTIDTLLPQEAELLAQGDEPEAMLVVLKRWYVAGSFHRTPEVVDRLAEALRLANPDDPGIVARWRLEQLERSVFPGSALPLGGTSMLDDIPLEPEPFASAARATLGLGHGAHMRRGNLWLLAGQAAQALEAFIAGHDTAHAPQQERNAMHGIARALRGVDRGVARGNAYVTGQIFLSDLLELPTTTAQEE